MSKHRFAGAFLLVASVLAGCGAQPGHTTVTYNTLAKDPPPLATASHAGEYRLFPSDGTNAIYTADLQRGDTYGFVKDDSGRVVGVAQDRQIPLTAKLATAYYWKDEGGR